MIHIDGIFRVWQRNFYQFRKTWLASAFWIVLEPLMYLGAIGYGMGAYVNNMDGQGFLEFYFPGLLCSTAMMVAFFEGTYANYSKLTYQKLYSTIMLAPISPEEIINGEIIWCSSKGLFGVLGVTMIAFFFGLVESWRILPAIAVLFLTAWVFSCAALLVISYARNYDSFIFATSGFVIPMSLISGTYFPMDSLPLLIKVVAYCLPLAHSTHAVRHILNNSWDISLLLNLVYLLVVGLLLKKFASARLTRRLYS